MKHYTNAAILHCMYSPLTVTATRYISNVWNTILMQQFFTACIVHWLLQLQVTLATYEACNVARHRPHTALYVLLLLPTLTLAVHTWVCCTIADLQRLTFIYLQQCCVGLLTSIVRQSLRHRQLHTHTARATLGILQKMPTIVTQVP